MMNKVHTPWAGWGLPVLASLAIVLAQPLAATAAPCGAVTAVPTHDGSTTRYAYRPPSVAAAPGAPTITLVLLPGGSGRVDLDEQGCARALKGNSLVRSLPEFGAQGLGTALVDASSNHQGVDGLGGFRSSPQHAEDLGRVIARVREQTGGQVWLVGTSRGTISAANVATNVAANAAAAAPARLSGPAAPDGVVLTSVVTAGHRGGKKSWVAHTVFDFALADIRLPLLLVGHAADACARSPATLMAQVAARTQSRRQQVVTVTGGVSSQDPTGAEACEGRSPHGFLGVEAELAAGVARFVRGGVY